MLFRRVKYKGATCYICCSAELRRILFRKRIVAFQVMDALLFRDEDVFANDKVREHEYRHFQDWKRHRGAYLIRYTHFAVKKGYRKNPYEVLARMAGDRH